MSSVHVKGKKRDWSEGRGSTKCKSAITKPKPACGTGRLLGQFIDIRVV